MKDIISTNENIYLFARFIGKPETFSPLFDLNDIRQIFDSRTLNPSCAEKEFWKFYEQSLSKNDKNNNTGDSLDGNPRIFNIKFYKKIILIFYI